MNSATAIASGVAISRASAAANSVPYTSGHAYDQKPSPSRMGASTLLAVIPGIASTVRKIATLARMIRMSAPAESERPEKIRSPRRWTGRAFSRLLAMVTFSCSLVVRAPGPCGGRLVSPEDARRPPGGSFRRDVLDDLGRVGRHLVGQRCGTGLLGGGPLAFGAHDVAEVLAHQARLFLRVVLAARDAVRDQDDRVDPLRGRRTVDVERHAGIAAARDRFRVIEGGRCRLR